MDVVLVLLLPAFVAAGLIYLFIVMGEAVVTAVSDWVKRFI